MQVSCSSLGGGEFWEDHLLIDGLELLLWRSRSDYARIEVRGAGVDLSLITGLAKPPAGRTAELPALPRRVFRRLELAGMTQKLSRRDDVITFRRP